MWFGGPFAAAPCAFFFDSLEGITHCLGASAEAVRDMASGRKKQRDCCDGGGGGDGGTSTESKVERVVKDGFEFCDLVKIRANDELSKTALRETLTSYRYI